MMRGTVLGVPIISAIIYWSILRYMGVIMGLEDQPKTKTNSRCCCVMYIRG